MLMSRNWLARTVAAIGAAGALVAGTGAQVEDGKYVDIELPPEATVVERVGPIGEPISGTLRVVDANAIYSNVTTFPDITYLNGNATVIGANTITQMVMDDLMVIANTPGSLITGFRVVTVNANAVTVPFRYRVRFYQANGAGGGPGTLMNGFSLTGAAGGQGANTYAIRNTNIAAASQQPVPADGKVWIGVSFDNNAGTYAVTQAQLNNLGLYISTNPPEVGSSADTYFETTNAGDFLASNPVGAQANFGGAPYANFGFELVSTVAPGACCDPSAMCTTGVTRATCEAVAGSLFLGPGSTCSPTACDIPGACCQGTMCSSMTQADCTTAGGLFEGGACGARTCACELTLPMVDGVTVLDEGEPCGGDTNGGCNSGSPIYTDVPCGNYQVVGTAYYDGATRDTDWYRITVPSDTTITATLQAEFDGAVGIRTTACPSANGFFFHFPVSSTATDPCSQMVVATAAVPAGTYVIFVAPQFTVVGPCGNVGFPHNDYVLTVTTDSCDPAGQCCDGATCIVTTEANCISPAVWTANENCDASTEYTKVEIITIANNDVNLPARSTITVSDAGTVSSIEVEVNMQHTYIGDLVMTLDYNGGGTTNLISRVGQPGTTTAAGASTDLLNSGNYIFTDGAGDPDVWTACNVAGDPAYTASLAPGRYQITSNDGLGMQTASTFAGFNGSAIAGNWTLTITDAGTGDAVAGRLFGWKIRFNGGGDPACESPPPTGACCKQDGSCEVLTQANCLAIVPTPNSWASGDTCPPMMACQQPAVGACCDGDVCTVGVSAANCSGTWDAGNSCAITAGPPHSFCCPGNFNRSMEVNPVPAKDVTDVFAALSAYFAGIALAQAQQAVQAINWDGDGDVDLGDFFLFFADWFAACP